MARIRADYVFGTTDAALTDIATTLSAPALTRLPAVASPDVAAVTLHDAATGAYEIVHVTAHTAAAATATILRGQEGSTAQAWASGASWTHGPTATDLDEAGAGSQTLDIAVVTSLTQSSTSLTFAAITGATVTFTVPASGVVVIDAQGGWATEPNHSLELCLLDGGSQVAGSLQRVARPGSSSQGRWAYRHVLTGLTPGAGKTYSLAMRRGDGTANPVTVLADTANIWGQLVVEVRASPLS